VATNKTIKKYILVSCTFLSEGFNIKYELFVMSVALLSLLDTQSVLAVHFSPFNRPVGYFLHACAVDYFCHIPNQSLCYVKCLIFDYLRQLDIRDNVIAFL